MTSCTRPARRPSWHPLETGIRRSRGHGTLHSSDAVVKVLTDCFDDRAARGILGVSGLGQ
ncbi:hypothetical protein [Streptomyces sp. NPDC052811]|uniref:hypothetical protein n=1 Tax=Streptomyces sp. NPDC052811 TaxID=3155731 RepID=UPI00341DBC26